MLNRRLALAAVLALTTAGLAGPASAHAHLVSSTPANNSVVAGPNSLRLTFNERLVAAFSTFEITDERGRAVPVRVTVAEDGMSLRGVPTHRLAAGLHTVTWRAATSDGHRMTGTFTFTVR